MTIRKHEGISGEYEHPVRMSLCPPVNEVLCDVTLAESTFDVPYEKRGGLLEQIAAHQELSSFTDRLIRRLPSPDITLHEALVSGSITSGELTEFYVRMSDALIDPELARLVLYMPFEWLPNIRDIPGDAALQEATSEFREGYINAWWTLLREHDVRAHFDDGDMRLDIDASAESLPLVIKAAHLLPFLLEKGMITEDDVMYIREGTNSGVLRQSIDEAMTVYRHLGGACEVTPADEDPVTPKIIRDYYAGQLENFYHEREAMASPQRLEWLQKVAFETTVQDVARRVARQPTPIGWADETLDMTDTLLQATACVALGYVVEDATSLPDERTQALELLLERGSIEVPYFSMTLCRLYHGGLVDEVELATRGVNLPRLHGELSNNLDLDSKEMEPIRTYIETVQNDDVLRDALYPVVLIGGSRLKGYGDEYSDIDVTICVRPGVDIERRDALLTRAIELLGGDKPHEFWLEQVGDRLAIRDIGVDDVFVGNDYWVHVLFGAAWVGDERTIRDVQSELYPSYFEDRYVEETAMSLRQAYLKRIEDDVLLYRLLHRGYAHHYPTRGGLDTPYAELIDGSGVFYDSGYRQLATQLFLEKVFLPKID